MFRPITSQGPREPKIGEVCSLKNLKLVRVTTIALFSIAALAGVLGFGGLVSYLPRYTAYVGLSVSFTSFILASYLQAKLCLHQSKPPKPSQKPNSQSSAPKKASLDQSGFVRDGVFRTGRDQKASKLNREKGEKNSAQVNKISESEHPAKSKKTGKLRQKKVTQIVPKQTSQPIFPEAPPPRPFDCEKPRSISGKSSHSSEPKQIRGLQEEAFPLRPPKQLLAIFENQLTPGSINLKQLVSLISRCPVLLTQKLFTDASGREITVLQHALDRGYWDLVFVLLDHVKDDIHLQTQAGELGVGLISKEGVVLVQLPGYHSTSEPAKKAVSDYIKQTLENTYFSRKTPDHFSTPFYVPKTDFDTTSSFPDWLRALHQTYQSYIALGTFSGKRNLGWENFIKTKRCSLGRILGNQSVIDTICNQEKILQDLQGSLNNREEFLKIFFSTDQPVDFSYIGEKSSVYRLLDSYRSRYSQGDVQNNLFFKNAALTFWSDCFFAARETWTLPQRSLILNAFFMWKELREGELENAKVSEWEDHRKQSEELASAITFQLFKEDEWNEFIFLEAREVFLRDRQINTRTSWLFLTKRVGLDRTFLRMLESDSSGRFKIAVDAEGYGPLSWGSFNIKGKTLLGESRHTHSPALHRFSSLQLVIDEVWFLNRCRRLGMDLNEIYHRSEGDQKIFELISDVIACIRGVLPDHNYGSELTKMTYFELLFKTWAKLGVDVYSMENFVFILDHYQTWYESSGYSPYQKLTPYIYRALLLGFLQSNPLFENKREVRRLSDYIARWVRGREVSALRKGPYKYPQDPFLAILWSTNAPYTTQYNSIFLDLECRNYDFDWLLTKSEDGSTYFVSREQILDPANPKRAEQLMKIKNWLRGGGWTELFNDFRFVADQPNMSLLAYAAYRCDDPLVSLCLQLVDAEFFPQSKKGDHTTPLHQLSEGKNWRTIFDKLIKRNPESLALKDLSGLTPLEVQAKKGHLEIVTELGNQSTYLRSQVTNAASLAAQNGHTQVVDYLINTYPSFFTDKSHLGLVAAAYQQLPTLQLILQQEPSAINALSLDGLTVPDYLARGVGNKTQIQQLFKKVGIKSDARYDTNNHLGALPDELIVRIFQDVDEYPDVYRVMLTCKQFALLIFKSREAFKFPIQPIEL